MIPPVCARRDPHRASASAAATAEGYGLVVGRRRGPITPARSSHRRPYRPRPSSRGVLRAGQEALTEGIARLEWYALHYAAQAYAYALVLDRTASPTATRRRWGCRAGCWGIPSRSDEQDDDLTRSRLTGLLPLSCWPFHILFLAAVVVDRGGDPRVRRLAAVASSAGALTGQVAPLLRVVPALTRSTCRHS